MHKQYIYLESAPTLPRDAQSLPLPQPLPGLVGKPRMIKIKISRMLREQLLLLSELAPTGNIFRQIYYSRIIVFVNFLDNVFVTVTQADVLRNSQCILMLILQRHVPGKLKSSNAQIVHLPGERTNSPSRCTIVTPPIAFARACWQTQDDKNQDFPDVERTVIVVVRIGTHRQYLQIDILFAHSCFCQLSG